jgi:hypothetical protein
VKLIHEEDDLSLRPQHLVDDCVNPLSTRRGTWCPRRGC